MTAVVLKGLFGSFYAVEPGPGPGQDGEPGPVFYEHTLNGLCSAIAHAQHLSAGGGTQRATLTRRGKVKILREFANGAETYRSGAELLPPPYRAVTVPGPETILRAGSPRGKITEISRIKRARKTRRTTTSTTKGEHPWTTS